VLAVPEGQSPTAPTPAFTLLKDLDWRTPGELPLEKKESTSQKVSTRRGGFDPVSESVSLD
jgi:hypothetical protein